MVKESGIYGSLTFNGALGNLLRRKSTDVMNLSTVLRGQLIRWLCLKSEFLKAARYYMAGLEDTIETQFEYFVVPFGKKHRKKIIRECHDKEWMLWTQKQPYLVKQVQWHLSSFDNSG